MISKIKGGKSHQTLLHCYRHERALLARVGTGVPVRKMGWGMGERRREGGGGLDGEEEEES